MLSVKLKQVMQLQLDTAAMRGPVNRSDIAEAVYAMVRDSDEYWSLVDKALALKAYIRDGVSELMDEKMSEDYLRAHLGHVPRQYLHLLEKLPRFMCINASAGLHVLAVNASREDWSASAKIKRTVADHTNKKANEDEDVYRALVAEGVNSIAELGERLAA